MRQGEGGGKAIRAWSSPQQASRYIECLAKLVGAGEIDNIMFVRFHAMDVQYVSVRLLHTMFGGVA